MASAETKKHAEEVIKLLQEKKKQPTSVKVEMSIEERNEKVLQMLSEGIKVKEVANRLNIKEGLVYQIKSQANKQTASVERKPVKPLREKDIKPSTIANAVKDPGFDTQSNDEPLKARILDLEKQLDRFREVEKDMRAELIEQKLSFEKALAAERAEKEKAYADYTNEVENSKRLHQQVQDLLMADRLNEGLMQQNLMFRKRLGNVQEGAQI